MKTEDLQKLVIIMEDIAGMRNKYECTRGNSQEVKRLDKIAGMLYTLIEDAKK